ncbi:MAG TPA: leucyl aminopeptidase [Chthoniobacteraceae bacterium]|nr:leucyl aminopeptidase [Chthoniobacteraceae bacterium]
MPKHLHRFDAGFMKLTVAEASRAKGATLVRCITREDRATVLPNIPEAEFSAKPNTLLHLREEDVLYVGLGKQANIRAETFRAAAGTATIALKKMGRTRLALALEEWPEFVGPAVEGVELADYRFDRFAPQANRLIETLQIQIHSGDASVAREAAQHALIVAEATNLARAIGNLPGNLLYPETLAKECARMVAATSALNGSRSGVKGGRSIELKLTVFDEKKLRVGGFGGLIAVGQGSRRGPRLIQIEHRGGARKDAPIVLVGKAITFDTGGISIKPAANMEEMIFDKCGGTAVLGAMAAISRLQLKRNVIGLIASAENMPGSSAYRPGDIVTTYDGKHIEIVNTDAEGRVVLADAIAYARRGCNAAAIIDLATLTGACVVALGETAAGLWSNNDPLRDRLLAASEGTAERVWPMPLYPEHDEQIKSDVALIKNVGGRWGGACTAAAFLKAFAEDTPWAHLDVAPVAAREKDRSDLARGATGFGVRTLVKLIEDWS